jgi:tellurite resistance protein TehA-like permease
MAQNRAELHAFMGTCHSTLTIPIPRLTPFQFATTMGTGIVSILLHTLSSLYPRHHAPLHALSIAFFALNVLLFSTILLISVLRYTLFPATWTLMIRHPVQSLFLGTVPMGFATLVNMFVAVCVPAWGGANVYVAWGMWWVDAAASMACCLGVGFQM